MTTILGEATIACSCGQLIHEMDSMFCTGCGDVMCYDCLTECVHCSGTYCVHCSDNGAECIKCHLEVPSSIGKAYLVIDGDRIPVKNSDYLINKTSISNARELTLRLKGRRFQYSYRSLHLQDNKRLYDYIIHFEEVVELELKADDLLNYLKIQNLSSFLNCLKILKIASSSGRGAYPKAVL
jgi:hypothetical protein